MTIEQKREAVGTGALLHCKRIWNYNNYTTNGFQNILNHDPIADDLIEGLEGPPVQSCLFLILDWSSISGDSKVSNYNWQCLSIVLVAGFTKPCSLCVLCK